MKRKLALALSALFLFVSLTILPAAADPYYNGVGPFYLTWAKLLFQIDGIDENIRTSRDGDDITVTSMEKVSVYSNRKTLDVEKVSFRFYDDNIYYTDEQIIVLHQKLLSFLCAIEGGSFLIISNEEARAAMEKATDIYDALINLTDEQYRQLKSGDYLMVYISKYGTYYRRIEYMQAQMIYFVPNGQPALGKISKEEKSTEKFDIKVLTEQTEWLTKFRSLTQTCMKDYYATTLDNVSLTLSSDGKSVQAMNIYFTWSAKNGEERTKKMLQMYSDDLAARLHNGYPDLPISSLTVFWAVPYHSDVGFAAKYQYYSEGDKMYLSKTLGLLYGKD